MTTVQCNCGAVKVGLSGDPVAQFYCHCDDCQRVHQAAYVPVAMYPVSATKILAGSPMTFKLKETPRTMCPQCGTRLFAEPAGMGVRGVIAYLLPQGSFKPAFHVQCQHALLPIKDELPHFKGYPEALGGTNDLVEW
jgi:hypothetical protein